MNIFCNFKYNIILDSLRNADSMNNLNSTFKSICEYYNIEKFALSELIGIRNKKMNFSFYSTYPTEWMQHYQKENYHQFDPVFLNVGKIQLPFFWNSNSFKKMNYHQKKVFTEAYDFNITYGTTIPLAPDGNRHAYLTILNAEVAKNWSMMNKLALAANMYYSRKSYFEFNEFKKLISCELD